MKGKARNTRPFPFSLMGSTFLIRASRFSAWLSVSFLLFAAGLRAAPPAPATPPPDALGRTNPRAAVTGFLEACHKNDYTQAAQYLDLTQLPQRRRTAEGPNLARELEEVLNSASRFDALLLSQNEQGSLTDDPDPNLEHVVTIDRHGQSFTIELVRSQPASGVPLWLFAPSTVAAIPVLSPPITPESAIAARLPRFLVSNEILETPLWKWIALLLLALLIASVLRLGERLLFRVLQKVAARVRHSGMWAWIQALLRPALVLVAVTVFRILEEPINPAALGRLYVGRVLLLIVVSSLAWSLSNLIELFLRRVDSMLDPRQRVVSHSLLYLGQRGARVVVVFLAGVIVLSNWGYDMTTIIAGLGVGGIAVALAAQQTIANVFGGVSVIGDHPVMIGDFGNFGGLLGTVEDIGMRSTRVRTPNRTVVSIPNSAFAGMNLENYSVRDKILFNPTLQIKRSTDKAKLRHFVDRLNETVRQNEKLEAGPQAVRISGYSAASFAVEVFAYVRTDDMNAFYRTQGELFLAIDDLIADTGVELA
jgi:MscS family membrane protein